MNGAEVAFTSQFKESSPKKLPMTGHCGGKKSLCGRFAFSGQAFFNRDRLSTSLRHSALNFDIIPPSKKIVQSPHEVYATQSYFLLEPFLYC